MTKYLFAFLFLSSPLYAASVGPIFPSTCSNVALGGGGTGTWLTPGNGTVEDGVNTVNTSATSTYLYCSGYDFSSIPGNARITGITLGGKEVYTLNTVTDNSVRLFQNGSPVGNDQATGSNWPFSTLAWVNYGGSTDLWGITPTRSDVVNDVLFGAGISAIKLDAGSAAYAIDAERMTIDYALTVLGPSSISSGKINSGVLH